MKYISNRFTKKFNSQAGKMLLNKKFFTIIVLQNAN